jgi:hypothetical protein
MLRAHMKRIFVKLVIVVFGCVMLVGTGCAWKKKGQSRIYEGDGPTIRYTGNESAGGAIGGR